MNFPIVVIFKLMNFLVLQAYQDHFKSEVDIPKFTVIVAQKDRHTKLFQDISPENVPSGQLVCRVVLFLCFFISLFFMMQYPTKFHRDRCRYRDCASQKL